MIAPAQSPEGTIVRKREKRTRAEGASHAASPAVVGSSVMTTVVSPPQRPPQAAQDPTAAVERATSALPNYATNASANTTRFSRRVDAKIDDAEDLFDDRGKNVTLVRDPSPLSIAAFDIPVVVVAGGNESGTTPVYKRAALGDERPILVPPAFSSVPGARILVLDNDETTGYYQLLSLLYGMYCHLSNSPPPRAVMIEALKAGVARPGSKEMLQLGARLKSEGRIDHFVIFTAASNQTGWVSFLVSCLEEYAGLDEGSIEGIVCREDVQGRAPPLPALMIKDLRRICTAPSNVLIVDDKPQLVQFGNVIGVSPYEQHVSIAGLIERIPTSEAGRAMARKALEADEKANVPPSEIDFSGDRELFDAASAIEAFFPRQLPNRDSVHSRIRQRN
jgi:hypothetical protein